MAEEEKASAIGEVIPPKVNPLGSVAPHTTTLKAKPMIRPGAPTQTGLKPGIKLPPKPGLATAGLKLPPKPGATLSGLKPGIRLPTQTGLKPGIKLPPKPGATLGGLKPGIRLPTSGAAKPVVKPVEKPVAKPAEAAVEMTPVEAPKVAEAPKAVEAPKAAEAPKPAEAPKAAEAPKPVEAPKPLDALKTVTQNLKSITAPIPQQAILRKTGIIADAEMTEAQKQAAKSKTSRISLSDAMGVAPVKNEALPMKTIRIKRPTDIPGATVKAPTTPVAPPPMAPVDAATPAAPAKEEATPAATTAPSFTQRKTLKISRPTGGMVRPAGKFGVKKPTASATPPAADKPAGEADVADIPDMPTNVSAVPPVALSPANAIADVPKGVASLSIAVQLAACLALGFLGWLLYQNTLLPLFCGGCA